jgi:hypothetical protein
MKFLTDWLPAQEEANARTQYQCSKSISNGWSKWRPIPKIRLESIVGEKNIQQWTTQTGHRFWRTAHTWLRNGAHEWQWALNHWWGSLLSSLASSPPPTQPLLPLVPPLPSLLHALPLHVCRSSMLDLDDWQLSRQHHPIGHPWCIGASCQPQSATCPDKAAAITT